MTFHVLRFTSYALCYSLLVFSGRIFAQEEVALTLDQALSLASQNNEKVLKAQKVLDRAKANLRAQRSIYLPQVGLTGFYDRRKNDDIDLDDKDYLSRISLSQLIARFGAVPADLDLAQEEVRKSEIGLEAAKKEVIYALRRLWHDIILTEEEIEGRGTVEQALQAKLKGAKRKHAEKLIPILSVLNTELELSEQQLALNELRRRLDIDKAELIRLTGLLPLTTVSVSEGIPDDDLTLEAAVESALVSRLDLRDFLGEIRHQQRLVKETFWRHIPDLSASLRYRDAHLFLQQQDRTWDAVAAYDPAILERDLDDVGPFERNREDRDGWEFRLNLNVSLFDGLSTESQKDAASAELSRLQLELQDRQKQIRVEVRRAYRAVANAKERMEIEGKRVQIFEQRLRTIERVLDEDLPLPSYQGLTFDDAFEAQAQFTEAQRVSYQARRDYASAKEDLRQTMGWIQ